MIRKILIFLFAFFVFSSFAFQNLNAFDEEDYLHKAFDAQDAGDMHKARDMFLVLYDETRKPEYLRESILVGVNFENPRILHSYIEQYFKLVSKDDLELERILLDIYFALDEKQKALETAQKIFKLDESINSQIALGFAYENVGDYDNATKQFEAAYEELGNKQILLKLLELYLSAPDTKFYDKADALFEQYFQNNACDDEVCGLALKFYASTMRLGKIENLLQREYEKSPTIQNAQALARIYIAQKRFDKAAEVLSKHPFDPRFSLELYEAMGDFENASKAARLAYESTKNAKFLALCGIYKFESLDESSRADKTALTPILKDMQKAIALLERESTLTQRAQRILESSYNFTGYLMIDNDINVKRGMEYVRRALSISQKSEYIDSLAWGYYKLGECGKAKDEFSKISESEVQQDSELSSHAQKIQQCGVENAQFGTQKGSKK